ncbi:hypothetical protein ACN4FV_10850, partial [Aliarcobacter butzleri]|uniref:hypothetical protein n=1 Tax=Aliarcobacter butzleri TaxID=28197 RepID=UPI003AF9648B
MQGAAHIYGITHTETHHADLRQQQITPLLDTDPALNSIFKKTDCVYDAVGGNLADQILQQLNPDAHFYSYGLLSGQSIR